ncbi:MAG: hypothetical protein ACPIA9_00670 [Flavobacteriaceae bacterium]
MSGIRSLFEAYIQSSIHVGFAVVSLVAVTSFQFEIAFDYRIYFFAFAATLLGYNTIKYGWQKSAIFYIPVRYQVLTLMATGTVVLLFWTLSWEQQLVFLALGVLVLFYTFPLQKGRNNLRNKQKIKIYWVALVWSVFTGYFPVAHEYIDSYFAFALVAHRWLFVLCATLPFEIRDLHSDAPSLRTWPQRFGVSKTRWIGVLLLVIAELFALIAQWQPPMVSLWIHPILIIALLAARTTQGPYYASFWVEAIPMLWLFLSRYFLN